MPEALTARFVALRTLTLLSGATLLLVCLVEIARLP